MTTPESITHEYRITRLWSDGRKTVDLFYSELEARESIANCDRLFNKALKVCETRVEMRTIATTDWNEVQMP